MMTHAHHHHRIPLTRRNATTAQRLGHGDTRTKYMHWGQIWKLAIAGTSALLLYGWLTG
jgi:hypothetical protein